MSDEKKVVPDVSSIRYLRLNDGRIAFGMMEEMDSMWKVTGAYLRTNSEFGETVHPITGKPHNALMESRTFEPFSPVSTISTIHIPKTKIDGEIVDMPRHIALMLVNMWESEVTNNKRRERMLSMPVVGRNGLSPEETLALVAQHMKKNGGALPQSTECNAQTEMGTIGGIFNVKQASPYRASDANVE